MRFAQAWGGRGLRVNAVAPGYTRTQLIDELIESGKFNTQMASLRVPLGRLADPAEIANSIFYLASDKASFVNGVTLVTDGGLLAYGGSGPASAAEAPRQGAPGRPRSVIISGLGDGASMAIARSFVAAGDQVTLYDPTALWSKTKRSDWRARACRRCHRRAGLRKRWRQP